MESPAGPDRADDRPAVLDAERRLARFERVAGIGTWEWDVAADRVRWSAEMRRIWDFLPHVREATLESVLARVHRADRTVAERALTEALELRVERALEHRVVLQDGRTRWVESRASIVEDDDGRVRGLHGTSQDMSGRVVAARAAKDVGALLDALGRIARRAARADALGADALLSVAVRELCRDGRWPLVRAWRVDASRRLSLVARRTPESAADPRESDDRPSLDARTAAATGRTSWRSGSPPVPAGGDPLRGGFALPVRCARGVVGVIEVVSGTDERPSPTLRAAADALAALLSLIVEHGGAVPAPARSVPARSDLAGAVERALERAELTVVYQPQVSLGSDRVVAAEALLRWCRPEGEVSPAVFIPVAEATGDIVAIGEWMLREACRQAAAWTRTIPDLRPWHVSVNVSARQFDDALCGSVASALEESGLDPASLRLEVTETALIADVAYGRSVLTDLRDLGVTVALDDFGTGYSSLAYFRRLDLDEVKIDREFVSGLGANPGDTAIVASVLSLAHALDRVVVAEGVETPEQVEHLRSLGCDLAQGFLYARPMSAAELEPLLRDSALGRRFGAAGERPGAPAPGAHTRLPTVLVVDDEAVVRRLTRMCLTAAGFVVRESATGGDALPTARRARPDCIVLDMALGDTTGLEVCRALREDPATADCAIVMLTSADDHTTKAAAFAAGADDYITKPFVPRELSARVQAAVRRREQGRPAR